jgi:hypothetical protein
MSGDRNVIMTETEKIVKFKDLVIAIQRMWYFKTKVAAVEIWANCITSKSFRKYLKYIPGKHDVKEVKKAVMLGILICVSPRIFNVGNVIKSKSTRCNK